MNFMLMFWRRDWQPTPVFFPGESHGQRSLAGYSPLGCKESDTTESLIHMLIACLNVLATCVCVVSEDDSFSEYRSDSDDVNIRPAKRQKTLMIDSDKEIENELHNAGECYFASAEE